jgi:hypothetical protein
MNPDLKKYPVIGKDVPWDSITNMMCRVIEFNPFAKIENGLVTAQRGLPYASLLIEPEKSPGIVELLILGKEEFRHLWRGLVERETDKAEEAIIIWSDDHKDGMAKTAGPYSPKLDILIYPKGFFDEQLRNPGRPNENHEEEWLFI